MSKHKDLVFNDTTHLTSDEFIEKAKYSLVKWYAMRKNKEYDNENYVFFVTDDNEFGKTYKIDFYKNNQIKNTYDKVEVKGQRKFDVQIVWFAKTLQNFKCMLTVINNTDRIYAEFIYNGDKNEYYLDVYDKIDNVRIGGKE